MAGPVARIFLRYFAGALFAKAGLGLDVTDPDVVHVTEMIAGLLLGCSSEALYALAHKRGWAR